MNHTQAEVDPYFDAVGRFIAECQAMEFWIYLTSDTLRSNRPFHKAERRGPKETITELRTLADRLADGGLGLLDALDTAEDVVEVRNQVVHGIHVPTATEGVRIAMRPSHDRDAKLNEQGEPPWIRGRLSRQELLAARDRARDVGTTLQASMMRWEQQIDDEG